MAALPPGNENKISVKTKKHTSNPLVHLPAYNAGARVGPPHTTLVEEDYDDVVNTAKTKNQVWTLVRQTDVATQQFSSWTRNNITVVPDSIGYLPIINAPATEMSTVYEILNQALKIIEKLNLRRMTCVFDQALYAKAIEITWKDGSIHCAP